MEKCGLCGYVTHEFVVFPEAKPREKTINKWVTRVHNPHFSVVPVSQDILSLGYSVAATKYPREWLGYTVAPRI